MIGELSWFSTRETAQRTPADPRQVPNKAGGHVFETTPEHRLRRFLVLGAEGGTYYTDARDHTFDAGRFVVSMAQSDHATLLATIIDVSTSGAAPKPNPCLFALAIAASHGTQDERSAALDALPLVARTVTHLFLFAGYIEQFRGWGRSLRRGVSRWYTGKTPDDLAYQVVKYRRREGWSHRDMLRLAHPVSSDPAIRAIFDWITHGATSEATPRLIEGFLRAREPGADIPALVAEVGLSWEMLPNEALVEPATWDALLDRGLPQTALMRHLPRLTRLGLVHDLDGRTEEVAAQLADPDRLVRARVHPLNVLVAQRTYASGHSLRGETTWRPSRRIVDALDEAFYGSFGAVEPAGKRTLLALDVSDSMTQPVSGLPLSCREASAALALVQVSTEPTCMTVGFTSRPGTTYKELSTLTPLAISPRQRLDDALKAVCGFRFGGTDCALPMVVAREENLEVDTFVVYTDNETWAGPIHPHQALKAYRECTGIPARLIVVGMSSTNFSIADPSDAGMLDVVGFDTAAPALISEFSRGL